MLTMEQVQATMASVQQTAENAHDVAVVVAALSGLTVGDLKEPATLPEAVANLAGSMAALKNACDILNGTQTCVPVLLAPREVPALEPAPKRGRKRGE